MMHRKMQDAPWTNNAAYDHGLFAMDAAVESCTSEVLLASLYRSVGFSDHSETAVPRAGSDFLRTVESRAQKDNGGISSDTWRSLLTGILDSPKQIGQSSKRSLQMTPIIPEIALYSGTARVRGSSWNPGRLISGMVRRGSENFQTAENLWEKLFLSLSVNPNDDIWARWLQEEFLRRKDGTLPEWKLAPATLPANVQPTASDIHQFPSKQFTRDLTALLEVKHSMTRRQWTSLLEALLRIGTTAHVLWICEINRRLWKVLRALVVNEERKPVDTYMAWIFESHEPYFSYGKPAGPFMKDMASSYLAARLGINLTLNAMDELGITVGHLTSVHAVRSLLEITTQRAEALKHAGLMECYQELLDREASTVSCKKGIGKNIHEFALYTLAQRRPSDPIRRSYDQGYFLSKARAASSSPWIFSMGPVAVLSMVHCCLAETSGPRSVNRLCDHLRAFGIKVDMDDINLSDLGQTLRMLGLVLDSPDAESGMLLLPPFMAEI